MSPRTLWGKRQAGVRIDGELVGDQAMIGQRKGSVPATVLPKLVNGQRQAKPGGNRLPCGYQCGAAHLIGLGSMFSGNQ